MGKKETKKYSDIPVQQTNASEPLGIYGDIIAQKDKSETEGCIRILVASIHFF